MLWDKIKRVQSYINTKLLTMLLLLPFLSMGQVNTPLDTSFTVYSSFQKEVKNFPFITIADPPMPSNVAVKENVVYKTMGARQLHLDVFYPRFSGRQYPGVILIHGGGWRSGNRSQTVAIARQLAAKGFVAACVEYRLSLEAKYPASLIDLRSAIQWMRINAKAYHLDVKKIASMGFSSGGQLAALLGTTNGKYEEESGRKKVTGDVQAIIDVDGILAFKHPESAEGMVAAFWLGGSYEEVPEVWTDASPLSHVDKHTPPVLFINSSLPRFHAGRDDMIKIMDLLGIYSEVHAFPDTPHPFWFFNPWFEPTVNFSSMFLEKVLLLPRKKVK